jgi:hypothetical protein
LIAAQVVRAGAITEQHQGTELAKAQCSTIRLKLLKIGALIRITIRKVWISLAGGRRQQVTSQAWPDPQSTPPGWSAFQSCDPSGAKFRMARHSGLTASSQERPNGAPPLPWQSSCVDALPGECSDGAIPG